MLQNRGDVRGHEKLILSEADDDRRAVANRDDLVRIVGRDQHEREQSSQREKSPADGVFQPVALHFPLDEVRHDLRIGLRDEGVAFSNQLLLQLEIVLDDAVVDDDDLAGAVAMRMGVLLGRPPVRGPARVADAVVAVHRAARDRCLEPRQFAGAAPELDRPVADERHARRVIAAILEPPQSVDENRQHFALPDVADDSAHLASPVGTRD